MRRLQLQASAVRVGDYVFWQGAYLAVMQSGRLPRTDRLALVLGNGGPVVTVFVARDALLEVRRPTTPEKTSTPHKNVT